MIFDWETRPATKESTRVSEHIPVNAGQTFKMETTPDGVEALNVTCPEDENWDVHVIVKITSTAIA